MNPKGNSMQQEEADMQATSVTNNQLGTNEIPEDLLKGLYAHAYDFYNKGKLNDAEKFFRFLAVYDFTNPDYIIGLAAVYQLKKEYQKACDLYAVAFALEKSDLRPVFFTGQCELSMGRAEKARKCFELVNEQSNNDSLKNKAQTYLNILNKNGIKPPDKE